MAAGGGGAHDPPIAAAPDRGPSTAGGIEGHHRRVTTYLIPFPGAAMQVPEAELAAVGAAAPAVVAEAQDAGVLVFAGGVHEGAVS